MPLSVDEIRRFVKERLYDGNEDVDEMLDTLLADIDRLEQENRALTQELGRLDDVILGLQVQLQAVH